MRASRTPPLDDGPGTQGLTLRALIHRTLLAAIVSGRLEAHARLPSARQLARDWRVSRNTVDDAVAALEAEGLVERRVGAGTFVTAHAVRAPLRGDARPPSPFAREALAQLSRWGRVTVAAHAPGASPRPLPFMAAMADLDCFPYALWRRLVARRLRSSARELAGYAPALGLPALQQAIARHLALARGLACEPERILVLNSAMQAADLIARVLLGRGRHAWIEDPTFPNLRAALALSGARLVPVAVDALGLDVDRAVARAPRAALAYVTPTCHYPLGVALSAPRRRALLDWATRANAWIVEDDYQSEFVHDARAGIPLATLAGDRVLHVGSFSSTMFPSLRLAYVVLPPALVDAFAAVRGQLDEHTHALGQAVLADFIDGGHYAAHVRRMRDVYRSRRDALVGACSRLPAHATLVATRAGMSAALLVRSRRDDRPLVDAAAAAGVATLPLSRYAIGRARHRGLLLGYAALDEREIEAGVWRLAKALGT